MQQPNGHDDMSEIESAQQGNCTRQGRLVVLVSVCLAIVALVSVALVNG